MDFQSEYRKRDKILFILSIFSIIISSLLVGQFLLSLPLILLIIFTTSAIYAIFSARSFNDFFLARLMYSAYAIAFSFLLTIFFAIVWSFLIFHGSYLDTYLIQYIYLLPLLIVFFGLTYYFDAFIEEREIVFKNLLKYVLVISLVLSLLTTITISALTITLYDSSAKKYFSNFDVLMSENDAKINSMSLGDQKIFQEILAYRQDAAAKANAKKGSFAGYSRGLCMAEDCFKTVVDMAFHTLTLTVDSYSISSILGQADKEFKYIQASGFRQESDYFNYRFDSLDEYLAFLKAAVDSANYSVRKYSARELGVLDMVERDFSFSESRQFEESVKQSPDSGALINLAEGNVFGIDSPFFNAIDNAWKHSTHYRQLNRLVLKSYLYISLETYNTDLFVKLYENKDIVEPKDSKTIRYRIIFNRMVK